MSISLKSDGHVLGLSSLMSRGRRDYPHAGPYKGTVIAWGNQQFIRSPFGKALLGFGCVSIFSGIGLLFGIKHAPLPVQTIFFACVFIVAVSALVVCFGLAVCWAYLVSRLACSVFPSSLSGVAATSGGIGHIRRIHVTDNGNRSGSFFLAEPRDHFRVEVNCPDKWAFKKHILVLAAHHRATLGSFSDDLLDNVLRKDVGRSIYRVAAPLGREFKITLLCAIFSHPGLMLALSARAGRLVLQFDSPVAADDHLTADEVRNGLQPFRQALLDVIDSIPGT